MIRALIFDFDGLIIDSETPDYLAWREVYAGFGVELPLDLWRDAIGTGPGHDHFGPVAHLEKSVGRPIGAAALRDLRRPIFLKMMERQPLLPGVDAWLRDAAELGLRIGLASSASRQWIGPRLELLGLTGRFACVRCREDVERVKPDPALYRCAAEALGVRPGQALALEDSFHGLSAAKDAGLWCAAVPNEMTRPQCFDRADLLVLSLAELPLREALRRLGCVTWPGSGC